MSETTEIKNISDVQKCCGCFSCLHVCPVNAIKSVCDSLGEQKPVVDENICIQCGKCKAACPSIHIVKKSRTEHCFAAWSKREIDLEKSTSGGVGAVLARSFLERGGIVYGVVFSNRKASHQRICTVDESEHLRGSKYVQSDLGNCYAQAKDDLNHQKKVIFFGTPCQIAGLKTYLGHEYQNLLTVDLICHGTPPAAFLDAYVNDLVKQSGNTQWDSCRFRSKDWYVMEAWYKEQPVFRENGKFDAYIQAFKKGLILQQKCYSCSYASAARVSDITIGDFWGLDRSKISQAYQGKVSLVLPNSLSGERFIRSCEENLELTRLPIEDALNPSQGGLIQPAAEHPERKQFLSDVQEAGFVQAMKNTDLYKNVVQEKMQDVTQTKIRDKENLIKRMKRFFFRDLKSLRS